MYGFISTFRLYPLSFKIGELNEESYERETYTNSFLEQMETDKDKGSFFIIQLFDREKSQLKDFDNFLGDVLDVLKRTGKYDDSIILIMSDHGFIPGPKPNYGPFAEQSKKLYSVPFAIKTSETGQGRLYNYPAQSIDIAPTLLAQILSPKELESMKFDGVDVLRNRPQREHYINFNKKDLMYKLLDMDGGSKPGLVEAPLSEVIAALQKK
jgi:arylsulfatase A-like enzyme